MSQFGKKFLTAFVCLLTVIVFIQSGTSFGQSRESLLFKDLKWRGIGLAHVGRVTDIDALEDNFSTVLVAAASGGVWKSTNTGTTWQQIFADYGSSSIGDVAFFQKDPNIIWVGTGESCTRNSVGWGDGIYKSVDGGITFENMGLRESKHISEVVTHPDNPDIVYVAAQGHLWGHGGDQGVYKTTDGGKTWEKLTNGLPDDGVTGASDIKMDPKNSNVLYAGMWERIRQPHNFKSGGSNGGIFKTTNGGKKWEKLTKGLPTGDTGKIGISIYKKNTKIVMAIVEAEATPDLDTPGTGIYRSENGGKDWKYISSMNNRPFYYSHIFISPVDDQTVYVLDGSGRISEDGGKTFPTSMPGISGDFHALWLDPNVKERFYVGNDKGSYITYDHGQTFTMFDDMDISQFYAVNVDMRDPYYVYGGLQDNGNWGAPSNSRDVNGILNDHWFKFHSGDGFHTTPDPNDWRTVYTESQGGRISRFDAVYRQMGKQITPTRQTILNYDEYITPEVERRQRDNGWVGRGGEVMPIRYNWSSPFILSPHNTNTIYFGGNYLLKSINRGETWEIISPDLSRNIRVDRESGGITRDVTAAEHHASLITISESPIIPGIIWTGTDDGNVQITRNDGKTWSNVRNNIRGVPDDLWVSRVEASHFDEGSAYVSFDGHRSDNYSPWIFKTTDYGRTWTNIVANIPDGQVVYVIKEDLKNPNLLFVGTESTVYASVNGGRSWERLMNDMPTAAVHDLVIHPRDGDLIAGTHGRGIWILDDITPLQQLNDDVLSSEVHLFDSKTATIWLAVSRGATRGHKVFQGRNPLTMRQIAPINSPPQIENSAAVHFYLSSPYEEVTLEFSNLSGTSKRTVTVAGEEGINRYYWDLRFEVVPITPEERQRLQQQSGFGGRGGSRRGPAAGAGTYLVKLTVGGITYTNTLTVRNDPGLKDMK